jgi:flagellar biosynthesis protein FlhG
MSIEDYQGSAHYRQRLLQDLHVLFPHLTDPDEQSLFKLTRETTENAYEARLQEIIQRFGPTAKETEARQTRLAASFEHLIQFLDARQAYARRHGSDPLEIPGDDNGNGYRSIFLSAHRRARLIAVGGGKGGIGKSMVAANMAVALAAMGRQVVAIDMDLGGADLHLALGLRTLPRSLNDFIEHKYETLDEVRLSTAYRNLSIIATDSSRLGVANIKFAHKEKVLRHLGKLDCDVVLVDLGAEVSFNVLDVFLAADHRYVVTSPEPASVLEAYGLVKLSLYRKSRHFASEMVPASAELAKTIDLFLQEKDAEEEGVPKNVWQLVEHIGRSDPELQRRLLKILYGYSVDLIVNMSERDADAAIAKTFIRLCQDNLAINLQRGYRVPWDRRVRESARRLIPIVIDGPGGDAAKSLLRIAVDAASHQTDESTLSHRLNDIAVGAKERVQKMREMAALNAPGQPVNTLIPVEEQTPTASERLRGFLNKEIRFRR